MFFGAVSELNPDGVTAKVKDIQISGDKVTVYSEEIGLADLFEYADVCMEVPLSRAIVESEGDEGTTVTIGAEPTASAQTGAFVHKLSTVKQKVGIGLGAELAYEKEHYTLRGSVTSTVTYVTLEFRFSREEMRLYTGVWADLETRQTLGFTAERAFGDSKRLARVQIPVYGILKLYLTPSVFWSGSGSMAGNITSTCTEQKGFTATVDAQGIHAEKIDRVTKPLTTDGTMEEMKGELSVGLELNAALGIGFVGNVYVAVRSGVTVAAELCPEETAKPEDEPDSIHACKVCFDGDVFGWVEISYGMKIRLISLMENLNVGKEVIDSLKESGLTRILDEKPLWQNRWNVADFYISIREEGPAFGWGECPNTRYKTTVTVYMEDGTPAPGATVKATFPDLRTDQATTDETGIAVIYLPNGENQMVGSLSGQFGRVAVLVEDAPSETTMELATRELVITLIEELYDFENDVGGKRPIRENYPGLVSIVQQRYPDAIIYEAEPAMANDQDVVAAITINSWMMAYGRSSDDIELRMTQSCCVGGISINDWAYEKYIGAKSGWDIYNLDHGPGTLYTISGKQPTWKWEEYQWIDSMIGWPYSTVIRTGERPMGSYTYTRDFYNDTRTIEVRMIELVQMAFPYIDALMEGEYLGMDQETSAP